MRQRYELYIWDTCINGRYHRQKPKATATTKHRLVANGINCWHSRCFSAFHPMFLASSIPYRGAYGACHASTTILLSSLRRCDYSLRHFVIVGCIMSDVSFALRISVRSKNTNRCTNSDMNRAHVIPLSNCADIPHREHRNVCVRIITIHHPRGNSFRRQNSSAVCTCV